MKKGIFLLAVFLLVLYFPLQAVFAQVKRSSSSQKAPLFLQFDKNYYLEGDPLLFSLSTSSGREAWYLLEIYPANGKKKVTALAGQLKEGVSAGKLMLPKELEGGVYWARVLQDGSNQELLIPFYIFDKPKEIVPEAQFPFQLKLSLAGSFPMHHDAASQLAYELWPPPLVSGGRVMVRDKKGYVLADTLLEKSGKGTLRFEPQAGDGLIAEVWLEKRRIALADLPQVLPVSFDWKITETKLFINSFSEDSLQTYDLSITGPEGFTLHEQAVREKEWAIDHVSWPSGKYTLAFWLNGEIVLKENFFLDTEKPALLLSDQELVSGEQYHLTARLHGIKEVGNVRWELRVQSMRQEAPLFKPRFPGTNGTAPLAESFGETHLFFIRELQERSNLNPSQLKGTVRDIEGKPVEGAVVSLVGQGLDRVYYVLSNKQGLFEFTRLPLPKRERYLLAFPGQEDSLLSTTILGLPALKAFPSVEIDSFNLKKARSYAEKHFLLKILEKEEEELSANFSSTASLPLKVPGEWISTFKTADYVDFDNIKEFMKEVIPGLRIREERGRSYVQVLNTVNSQKKVFYEGDPLYLLNGYPLTSADSLFSIDPDLVDSIQLVRRNTSSDYGRIARFGILALYTKRFEKEPLLPKEGIWLQPVAVNEGVDIGELIKAERAKKPGLPCVESLLQWVEKVEVQEDGSFSFDLHTTDEIGDFLVEIIGLYPDGRFLRLKQSLSVTPSVAP